MKDIFFGLFDNGTSLEPQVLSCDQSTQKWLKGEFTKQLEVLLKKTKEEKAFDPHALTHDDELYYIEAFSEKALMNKVISENTDSFPKFTHTDFQLNRPKAIGMVIDYSGTECICFQLFTQKNILSRNGILKFDHSLKKQEDYLICINNYLTGIYTEGKLKFRSFHFIKQIFNLQSFYTELSDTQIIRVVEGMKNMTFQEQSATLKHITQKTRKLFSALSMDDYVQKANAQKLAAKVKKDTEIDLDIYKGLVCLPKDPKLLFAVLNSLLGNIYNDERTNEFFTATSKERFEKP